MIICGGPPLPVTLERFVEEDVVGGAASVTGEPLRLDDVPVVKIVVDVDADDDDGTFTGMPTF